MFKRFFVLAMSFALMTTQSFAASQSGIKMAFDEFAYSMEVEGAALNPAARKVAVEVLSASIEELKNQGMTNQELFNFTVSQVKDKAVAQDLSQTFALMQSNQMSHEEIQAFLDTMATKVYSKGASWNGDNGMLPIYGFMALMIVVIVISAMTPPPKCADEAYARGNVDACVDSGYNGSYYNI
jgi:hypothetical protein